jgi:hypothetical protein
MKKIFLPFVFVLLFISGCKKTEEPRLVFKFRFDPDQERLNSVGQPSVMPEGHAGQNPSMNAMSAHYIELAPSALTPLTTGAVIYRAEETNVGGSLAIDFDKSVKVGDGEVFYSVPLKDIPKGSYEWLRVSLAYQNYDVKMYVNQYNGISINQEFPATIASFIGFNNYINTFRIKNQVVSVQANKTQGYWGFETIISYLNQNFPFHTTGQAPPNATTVPNPIASTSPIPAGSCVVTGPFQNNQKLVITGQESNDIVVYVSLSTNNSFEWIDVNPDGKWDPTANENIVDMGVRGLKAIIQ